MKLFPETGFSWAFTFFLGSFLVQNSTAAPTQDLSITAPEGNHVLYTGGPGLEGRNEAVDRSFAQPVIASVIERSPPRQKNPAAKPCKAAKPKRSLVDVSNESQLEKRDLDKKTIYKAIDIIKAKLDAKHLNYALIGGVAMQLQGMDNRVTSDFDMVVDATGRDIRDAVQGEGVSIVIGAGIWQVSVTVDGTKVTGELFDKSERRHFPQTQILGGYKLLTASELFRSKLKALNDRGHQKDYDDLAWLVGHKPKDIEAISGQLKEEWKEAFAATWESEGDTKLDDLIKLLKITKARVDSADPICLGGDSGSGSEPSDFEY